MKWIDSIVVYVLIVLVQLLSVIRMTWYSHHPGQLAIV